MMDRTNLEKAKRNLLQNLSRLTSVTQNHIESTINMRKRGANRDKINWWVNWDQQWNTKQKWVRINMISFQIRGSNESRLITWRCWGTTNQIFLWISSGWGNFVGRNRLVARIFRIVVIRVATFRSSFVDCFVIVLDAQICRFYTVFARRRMHWSTQCVGQINFACNIRIWHEPSLIVVVRFSVWNGRRTLRWRIR